MFRQSPGLRRNVFFRNDQQMSGSLRIDIRKANAEFIFINPIGWNSTGDDLTKQAVSRHGESPVVTTSILLNSFITFGNILDAGRLARGCKQPRRQSERPAK